MANLTFKKAYECPNGDHLRLSIMEGAVPSQEIGRTSAQLKTALNNGYTITI